MSEPSIDLRLWRQFLAVADELHFGRAAQRLHMTQPPLTQGIAQLERLLQVRLFDRTKRSVRLTAAGDALLPRVREILSAAAALPAVAQAAAGGETGRLRLAFVSTVGYELLPAWVRAFRAQHPQVQLELVEATGDVQLAALERGEIDAGFMLHAPGAEPPALATLRVAREPLVLAVPQAHALAAGRVQASACMREPLVIFPRRIAPALHDAVFEMYRTAGVQPRVGQEAIQMQTIVNLVSAGLGIAWVPDSVRQFQRPGVVYRALRSVGGVPVPHCETSLAWREPVSPVLARFIAFARSRAQAGEGPHQAA